MTTSKPAAPEQGHHFFASTAVSWAVASTRREAIAKAARTAGDSFIKAQIKSNGGLYVWSCRVDTPQSQHYSIQNYAPSKLIDENGSGINVAVPRSEPQEALLVNIKGHTVPKD